MVAAATIEIKQTSAEKVYSFNRDYAALINRSIHISLSEIMSSCDSAGKGRVSFHFIAIQIKEKAISK